LTSKVKFKPALMGPLARSYAWRMISDDESYRLDADGNRILIGLTYGETQQFEILDESVRPSVPRRLSRTTAGP
jgi:hypothetical protein